MSTSAQVAASTQSATVRYRYLYFKVHLLTKPRTPKEPSILELKQSVEQRIKACNDLLLALFYEKEELESDLAKINFFLEYQRRLARAAPSVATEAACRQAEPVRCQLRHWLFLFLTLLNNSP